MNRPLIQALRCSGKVLFPETCWISGNPLNSSETQFAVLVHHRLDQFLHWPFCRRCGATLGPFSSSQGCERCRTRQLNLQTLIRSGPLQEPLKTLIHRFKFAGHWSLAPLLARRLHEAMRIHAVAGSADVLVPVALHWRRYWNRGYNQAHELARFVGSFGKLPVVDALLRIRATAPQTVAPSAAARFENLRGAFAARFNRRLAGKHVWLVDDVLTSGATLYAAAAALRQLPAEFRPAAISAMVLAVTDDTPIPQA
jgi:ComF family protein